MGQYYKPVNIDTMEFLESWDFSNVAKLMEHSYVGNDFVNAVELLLIEGGRWDGNRLVWAGDYADEVQEGKGNYYELSGRESNEHNQLKADGLIHACPDNYRYICNLDKNEYVDKNSMTPNAGGWQIHPLPLLTADGNGRGGGDYHGTDVRHVGSWKGDRLSIRTEVPTGFQEIKLQLREGVS